ncbi:MAG TPA: hypothetical protein VKR06_22575, partial [Ktedonosporobacter sp.]|nr:hypothetical protein [Ktedonosporobacter sp.]
PCPKCGGQREYFKCNPDLNILLSAGWGVVGLQVPVCLSCGFVDLTAVYVQDVGRVRMEAENRRRKQG